MGEQHVRGPERPDGEALEPPRDADVRGVAGAGLRGWEPSADGATSGTYTLRDPVSTEPIAVIFTFTDSSTDRFPVSDGYGHRGAHGYRHADPDTIRDSITHTLAAHADARAERD